MTLASLDRPAATISGPTDQQVQTYLLTGLRNRWWPILPSRFVETGGKPIGLTRLGEYFWSYGAIRPAQRTYKQIVAHTARYLYRVASTKATDCAVIIMVSRSAPTARF